MPRQIGYRVRRIRDGAALTQAAAAAGALISRSYLSAIENGRRVPPPAILARILDVLAAPLTEQITLQAELAALRGWSPALRGLLRHNPELAGLLAALGARRLTDPELGQLGRCVALICVAHRRRALLQTQQAGDAGGLRVLGPPQGLQVPPGGGEGSVA